MGGTAKPELQGDWRAAQGCGGLHHPRVLGARGMNRALASPRLGLHWTLQIQLALFGESCVV